MISIFPSVFKFHNVPWLDQFLSCRQGTKQALSVWKLTSIHSGKFSNYFFDDFLPANSLFFLSETPVVWVVYLMNYLLTLCFSFVFSILLCFYSMSWEMNMNGELRDSSQLRKQWTWQTGTKAHKPKTTRREQNIRENENLGKIIIHILIGIPKRIGSCEKVTFGEHNSSTMIAKPKFQQKWNIRKPNGSSGWAQTAMTLLGGTSDIAIFWSFLQEWAELTEMTGVNLAASGREGWDLNIQYLIIHLITLHSQWVLHIQLCQVLSLPRDFVFLVSPKRKSITSHLLSGCVQRWRGLRRARGAASNLLWN